MKSSVFKLAAKMVTYTSLDGLFAVNKPMGMSSAQVIRDCQTYFNPSRLFQPMIQQELADRKAESGTQQRRRSRAKRDIRVKIGHGGTLDPLATGVLILGVGKATKALNDFQGNCTKAYEAVVVFGASTDTYDRVGRILTRRPYEHITREAVEAALAGFRGKYQQMPPLYSALKMNGKPLYEYAREGLPVPREIETREVDVSSLELVEWLEPGEHTHRWPTEEAGAAEKSLAERVWKTEHEQISGKAPEQAQEQEQQQEPEEEGASAAAAADDHQSFHRELEERYDRVVYDNKKQVLGKRKAQEALATTSLPRKRSGRLQNKEPENEPEGEEVEALMSGALSDMPSTPPVASTPKPPKGKGSDLIPPPPDPNAPPPWEGKGPAACRVRMTVSSGFYVRSFCHELGEKVGSAAMMAELVRTGQGEYALNDDKMVEYTELAKGEDVWGPQVERILHQYSITHSPQQQQQQQQHAPPPFESIYNQAASSPKSPGSARRRPSPPPAKDAPAAAEVLPKEEGIAASAA